MRSSIIRPTGVPTLRRSTPIRSRYHGGVYPYRYRRYHDYHDYHHYYYGPRVSFGFHVGYPYHSYGYYYGYGVPLYVTYPYVGYYRYYSSPYFHHHGYRDCGFYSGFYLRFGYHRASYFAACSGFGFHASSYHHHHVYYCDAHGYHHYHKRDCYLCYPSSSYTYVDVDLSPEEAVEEVTSAEAVEEVDPTVGEVAADAATVEPASALVEAEELVFASLKPAQVSFATGLLQFRDASYRDATESFYNATLEDPDSRLAKAFLGIALFAIAEYEHAAEYLRSALDGWDAYPAYEWDVRGLYSEPKVFDEHLKLLEERLALRPRDDDAHLIRAFVLFSAGDQLAAAPSLDHLRLVAEDERDRKIAERMVRAIERREVGGEPATPEAADPAVAQFLRTLAVRDVRGLDME